jgi:hypothetical protein
VSDDLISWLNAQIDEDERRAKWAATVIEGKWDSWEVVAQQLFACCDTVPRIDRVGQHLHYAADPARTLREVEAKRRIVAIHHPYEHGVLYDSACHGCGFSGDLEDPITENVDDCPMLRAIASVYSDRPGFKEEWRRE